MHQDVKPLPSLLIPNYRFDTAYQIHEDGPRHIPPTASLIEVHIHPLQLQVGVAGIRAGGIHAMFIAHHL